MIAYRDGRFTGGDWRARGLDFSFPRAGVSIEIPERLAVENVARDLRSHWVKTGRKNAFFAKPVVAG